MIEGISEISIDKNRHKAMPVYQQIHRKMTGFHPSHRWPES
ncbi:MAG: hypothetical protein ACYTBY_10940 [Planctomycetota bacterium]